MKELISKQELIHDLYTLDISLEDMGKVERYILNYEPIKSNMISEEDRECCKLNDIEWLEEEISRLADEIYMLNDDIREYEDEEDRNWEFEMGEDL